MRITRLFTLFIGAAILLGSVSDSHPAENQERNGAESAQHSAPKTLDERAAAFKVT